MCDAFSSNLGTMILGLWAISECTKFGCQRSHVGHEGPRGPIFCKYAKCFFSYRLYSTKLRLCRITTMVVVPSGCSGFFGPRSQMGHMGHFMKSCKMLLLLQIVWYYVEVVSHYYYGSGTFGVFRIFWSKVPDGPFYEIMSKYFFSYRLYVTLLRVCHISAMEVVPSGCSAFWGPRCQMGHIGHFMKSCNMLLLQISFTLQSGTFVTLALW